eukprot:scaffold614_cov212-Chaetoceros_neogracile.AAC.2
MSCLSHCHRYGSRKGLNNRYDENKIWKMPGQLLSYLTYRMYSGCHLLKHDRIDNTMLLGDSSSWRLKKDRA